MFPMTDQEVWERELRDFVPARVLDAHVHLWPPEAVPRELEVSPTDIGMESFRGYTLEQFRSSMARLLPGRAVEALAFGAVHRDLPREPLNRYVGEVQRRERTVRGLAVVAPHDSMDDVERWIEGYGLRGYKPYWSLVPGKAQDAVEIVDMLSPEQLQYANERGLIVMLHIPRRYRLAEPLNKEQIRLLASRYPNVRWIIAHIGRAYFMAALAGHIEQLCDLDNVWFDLAFVSHPSVIAYAIRVAGVGKVLFGSDLPVAELKGKSVDFNNQRLYVTEEPHAWSMSNPALGLKFTRFYYEQLRAMKAAAAELRLGEEELERIFFRNARELVGG